MANVMIEYDNLQTTPQKFEVVMGHKGKIESAGIIELYAHPLAISSFRAKDRERLSD